LRALTPLRQRSPKRRPTSPEDQDRLDWLHLQLCAVHQHAGCGPAEVHHDTQDRAHGKKAGHERGIPMCRQAHRDFHCNCGHFKDWTRDSLRAWQTAQVCYFQAMYDLHQRRHARDPMNFG
jgi:hypothetical protein